MLVSPWRRRQAIAEVSRRRDSEATYTEPLGLDAAQSDEEFANMKAFMKDFYAMFYTRERLQARTKLLEEQPQVAAHLAALVPTKATEEEFWQRHDYRCDADRILREWERNPAKGREVRAKALANGGGQEGAGVQGWWDSSMRNLRNSLSPGGTQDGGSPAKEVVAKENGAEKLSSSSRKDGRGKADTKNTARTSEQKLEDSLKAAKEDLERWTTMDAKGAVVRVPDQAEDLAEKEVAGQNVFGKWFRSTADDAGSSEKEATNPRTNPKEAAKSAQNGSSQQLNSRAQSLRDLGKRSGNSARTQTNAKKPDGRKRNSAVAANGPTIVSVPPKPLVAGNSSVRRSTEHANGMARNLQSEQPPTSEEVAESPKFISGLMQTLASIKEKLNKNDMLTSVREKVGRHQGIILALLVGFLAHAIMKWSVGMMCTPSVHDDVYMPSPRWYTFGGVKSKVHELVCGTADPNVDNGMAVEVFDAPPSHVDRVIKKKDYRRGNYDQSYQGSHSDSRSFGASSARTEMKNSGRRNYGGYEQDNFSGLSDMDNGGGFDVNSLLSSFMQNTDFSQFTGDEVGEDSTAVVPSTNHGEKKRKGVVGFFKDRFGKKSMEVAQPSVVVHQHVHHVVHHVLHEMKQG